MHDGVACIMALMSNRAYAAIWFRDLSESTLLPRFRAFLQTIPFSASAPGFTHLLIRAVDPSETPVIEHDLRATPLDAAGIIQLASDAAAHSDSAYELLAYWDLWTFDSSATRFVNSPLPLEIFCYAEEYDDGFWRENGHIQVDLGFEHLFTGHAGLLRPNGPPPRAAEHPVEAEFISMMVFPENRSAYEAKTRENIKKLLDWIARAASLPGVVRTALSSEGEENFQARLEEILAAR